MSGLGADDARRPEDGFRPELEGLRAVAVALVLLFHAQVPGWTGGYVGVDVFFVLSGFLITGLIVRELRATGTLDLPRFYARRARRLLPAAAVALVGTVALSAIFLPPLRLPDVGADAAAAALYVSNLRFAFIATDYLASDLPPSPLLHFWSLGVEEQFYLFWPAVLLGLALVVRLVARGRRSPSASVFLVVIAGIGLASLGLSIVLTSISQPWAFFSLPTRAWELAMGGALALLAGRTATLAPRLAGALVATGLGVVIASGILLSETTPFPGIAALLPTGGAALVIAGGAAAAGTISSRLLQLAPVRFLGRISYSLYLWHWPILVIPAAAVLGDLGLPARLGLVGVSVVVAAASQRWVEEPIRRGHLTTQVRRTLALAGATSLTVAVAAILVGTTIGASLPGGLATEVGAIPSYPPITLATHPAPASQAALASLLPTVGPSASANAATAPAGTAATPTAAATTTSGATLKPIVTPTSAPTPKPSQTPPVTAPVPSNLLPPLASARDRPIVYDNGCHLEALQVDIPACAFGDTGASTTVVLYGDSHAAQWFPALERIATTAHWRLISLTKSGCTPVDVGLWFGTYNRRYTECDTWRERAIARIASEHADLVVFSSAHIYEFLDGEDLVTISQRPALWDAGVARTVGALAGAAGKVAFLGDTPRSLYDVPACVSDHLDDALQCATPAATAINARRSDREATIMAGAGESFVDPTSWVCPDDPCPVIIGRYLVYRDSNHLTVVFAASLGQRLYDALPAPG